MPGLTGGRWRSGGHGEPDGCTDRETGGIEPGRLQLADQPAAYLTASATCGRLMLASPTRIASPTRTNSRLLRTSCTSSRLSRGGPYAPALENGWRRCFQRFSSGSSEARVVNEMPAGHAITTQALYLASRQNRSETQFRQG